MSSARDILDAEDPKSAFAQLPRDLKQVDAMKKWKLVSQRETASGTMLYFFSLTWGKHRLSFKTFQDGPQGLYALYYYHDIHGILDADEFDAENDQQAIERAKAKATIYFSQEGYFKFHKITEAEDPKGVFKSATRAKGVGDPNHGKTVKNGRVMRRLLSQYPVEAVYIWKQKGQFPRSEGVLQVVLKNWGIAREEWASFSHLAYVLMRWRNLAGAELFINGVHYGPIAVSGALYHIGLGQAPPDVLAKYRLTEGVKKKKQPAAKGEDPKRFFAKQMPRVPQEVTDILQYMPDDFVAAMRRGEHAEWTNDDGAAGSDWWPSFDDDNDDPENPESNPWTEYAYYWEYYTDGGKLFGVVMCCDKDGNHDVNDEAEVGTPYYKQLEDQYDKGWTEAMKLYWQWVIERSGVDPLGYVMPRRHDVKKTFAVGFKKVGDRIQIIGMRNVTTPPSPPAIMWPQLKEKAAEDPDWKKAMEYCLIDEEGFTQASEQEIVSDGGRWNEAKQRFDMRISWTDKAADANEREHIMQIAQQALNELEGA